MTSKSYGMTMAVVLGAIGKGLSTLDDLDRHLPLDRNHIGKAAARLMLRGLLERIEAGQYRLTASGLDTIRHSRAIPAGPRTGTKSRFVRLGSFRQRAWSAMRLTGRFTIGEIVTLAATDKERTPEKQLAAYLKALRSTGYIVELPVRAVDDVPHSSGNKAFRLIRDSGEIAPAYDDNGKTVYDHNTRELRPCA